MQTHNNNLSKEDTALKMKDKSKSLFLGSKLPIIWKYLFS